MKNMTNVIVINIEINKQMFSTVVMYNNYCARKLSLTIRRLSLFCHFFTSMIIIWHFTCQGLFWYVDINLNPMHKNFCVLWKTQVTFIPWCHQILGNKIIEIITVSSLTVENIIWQNHILCVGNMIWWTWALSLNGPVLFSELCMLGWLYFTLRQWLVACIWTTY